jgi:hypothetical protein
MTGTAARPAAATRSWPYAVLVGGTEEYGYQCLACQVMGPLLTYAATTGPGEQETPAACDPALALIPVPDVTGTGTGASTRTLEDELLDRAARDDYDQWLSGTLAAGGCIRPIRLRGTIRDIDPDTGEILSVQDTKDSPDKVIYLPCGDRRASVCPPCAETYRADTYQLIRAGLAGGKGIPESVAIHPCVFATFTAPSFGPVRTRVVTPAGG